MAQPSRALFAALLDMASRFAPGAVRRNRLSKRKLAKLKQASFSRIDKAAQILLTLQYRKLGKGEIERASLSEFGFRAFSQHDEDGILLFILSVIGTTNKLFVEIGCGNGVECNTANLTLNHAWHGLLIDGDPRNIEEARAFYDEAQDSKHFPPVCVNARVFPENVNDILRAHGFAGEIDLLSLDIDGFDWWVLKSLDCVSPRVLVIETPTVWGPEDSYTMPYNPDHRFTDPDYYGASLLAYVRLGREKGYRLIGCNRYGTNCFFLRNDVGVETFDEIEPASCFESRRAQQSVKSRRPRVTEKEWVEVP
jgi:hypothetical protein